jgi:hypothetical protein
MALDIIKTVKIITFHAPYNYGSSLQAFALQRVVRDLGYDCETINFRMPEQKEMYRNCSATQVRSVKDVVKYLLLRPYKADLDKKSAKFESFIANDLKHTQEYTTLDMLMSNPPQADAYITGSDQVWNTHCPDFNMAYFLPFVKEGRRISYAPSMAKVPKQKLCAEIKSHLSLFHSISVREQTTSDLIEQITGETPRMVLDPTLLLSKGEWDQFVEPEPLIDGDYLFFYTPYLKDDVVDTVKYIAKELGLKIVISNFIDYRLLYNRSFTNKLSSGPWDFLNLIKNARMVCSSSFHSIIFSVLFNVPFCAINALKDERMRYILRSMQLEQNNIPSDGVRNEKFKSMLHGLQKVDYSSANRYIEEERLKSISYLRNSLNFL